MVPQKKKQNFELYEDDATEFIAERKNRDMKSAPFFHLVWETFKKSQPAERIKESA
jgi:hypothetical protein